jgi:hypothetical protein
MLPLVAQQYREQKKDTSGHKTLGFPYSSSEGSIDELRVSSFTSPQNHHPLDDSGLKLATVPATDQ